MIRRRDKMGALSVDIERKVRALVDAGYYSNKSEVIKNAVIIMSLAYKENVPDTRESPVREMVKELKEFGVNVYGYDPLLSKEEIEAFGVKALDDFNVIMDCVIVAVAHDEFKKIGLEDVM